MKITNEQLKRIIKEELSYVLRENMGLKMFVLVGPPSVGKSTWINNTFGENRPYVINRDDIVEDVASGYGWTYDDMFATPPEDAEIGSVDQKYGEVQESPSWMHWAKSVFSTVMEANGKVHSLFTQRVAGAVDSGQDIVVDMTNMNARARSGALKAIEGSEEQYEKIAVVFESEGAEEFIKAVAQKRAEAAARMGKSKTIPPAVFDRMFASFEPVVPGEGFDKITSVDNRQLLQQLASEM